MVKKINAEEFKNEAMKGVAVVDFSAVWCGPCKMLAPVLEEVSEEMGDVNFYNVDVDENQNLAAEYGIMNIPAVLVLKDGQKKDILVGFKPKEALVEEIKALL